MELVVSFPLEAVGLFAFGMSGALVALEKRMDLIGVCVLAVTAACGGGMLRDVLLNQPLPAFFTRRSYLCIVVCAIAATLLLNAALRRHHRLRRFALLLDIADAVGLATFGTSAALTVVDMPGNLITCVFISCITACGGGMLRDLFAQRIPMIFRGPLYATPCILGAVALYYGVRFLPRTAAVLLCFALILGLRLLAIIFHIGMPKFLYYGRDETNAPGPAQ